jgi:hypothetical protein
MIKVWGEDIHEPKLQSQSYKVKAALIDADFAIKIGRFQNQKIIEDIVPLLVKSLYIHKHAYDNEKY